MSSDDLSRVADWVARSARVQHRACSWQRHHCDSEKKYRSSEVNKSIAIAIIDQNAPPWFTTKLMFSQKKIRSVVGDGLTNIYKRRVSLNIVQKERK